MLSSLCMYSMEQFLEKSWVQWILAGGLAVFRLLTHGSIKTKKIKLAVCSHTKQCGQQQERVSNLTNTIFLTRFTSSPWRFFALSLTFLGWMVSVHIFYEWLKEGLENKSVMKPGNNTRILKLLVKFQVALENAAPILTQISAIVLGQGCMAILFVHLIKIDVK